MAAAAGWWIHGRRWSASETTTNMVANMDIVEM
jgi:hypothetical protein